MTLLEDLFSVSGKIVLITGASGKIGSIICKYFARYSEHLILVDQNTEKLNALAEELIGFGCGNVTCFATNLELEQDREELIEQLNSRFERLDILINNAAFVGTSDIDGWLGDLEHQTVSTWRRALELNLTAPFHLIKGLKALILKSSSGRVINISSIYGSLAPDWNLYEGTDMSNPAAYGASKAGLEQLTRWCASYFGNQIQINAIAPGGIFRNQPKCFVQRYEQATPLKRMAVEEDIVGAVVFLSSRASAYITGQVINVDGGWGIK